MHALLNGTSANGTTRPWVLGRACLLCPGISDINLLGYGECIVYLDAEVAHRALDFGVSQ